MTSTAAKPLTNAQQVAAVILDQLGARRFMAMTGARDLVATTAGLQFKLPAKFAAGGVNMVRVELHDDLYTVIVGRFARFEFNEKGRAEGLYADQLQGAFTRLTGLDTHL
ncbi:hypothetical protein [Pseudomonas nitroreducens]|uniref:hypothetical protein n=1 Tax=Pseudomonas nitroreducens TaxID=46680 RepID=UPI002657AE82|nr:hypothetical protein [Pseudomonas nitroreducens]MCP1652726.1 hypothetical protein [Pseudomonas nitroreducens]